jgi:hypothetical protein
MPGFKQKITLTPFRRLCANQLQAIAGVTKSSEPNAKLDCRKSNKTDGDGIAEDAFFFGGSNNKDCANK